MIGIYISISLIAAMLWLIPPRPVSCTVVAEEATLALGVNYVAVDAGEESYTLTVHLDAEYVIQLSFSAKLITHHWYLTRGFIDRGQCTGTDGDIYYIGQRTDSMETN